MANHEIWYSDDRGNRLALLNNAAGFEYVKVVNDVGYFSLPVPLKLGLALLRRDARLEFWRAPSGGVLDLDFLGLLRHYRLATDSEGKTQLELGGPCINHLLKRRHILYYAGSSQATATAEYAGNLCKRLASENLGSDATDTTRDWTSLGLTIAPDLDDGAQVDINFHYKNLLSVLQEVAELSKGEDAPLYFGLVPLSPTSFEFQTKAGVWGYDRTAVGLQGTLGLEFGNLAEPELEIDWNDEITHVTAGGQGEGAARQTRTAQDDTLIGASAFGLIEGFKEARGSSTSTAVTDAAKAELEQRRPRRRFRGRIVNTRGFVYGREWGLGDKLTWSYIGQQGTGLVKSVKVSVDGGGKEAIDARLETEE